jgi:hypothetical protein
MLKNYEPVSLTDVKDEKEPIKRVQKSLAFCSNPIVSIIIILINCFTCIAQLIIGALNLTNCPIQPMIPIWLIVHGSAGILNSIITLTNNFIIKIKSKTSPILQYSSCSIGLFFLVWLILGDIWIYSIWNKVEYNSNSTQFYCDQLTYNIAFWPISAWNTMLILGCGYFILICCFSCCIVMYSAFN